MKDNKYEKFYDISHAENGNLYNITRGLYVRYGQYREISERGKVTSTSLIKFANKAIYREAKAYVMCKAIALLYLIEKGHM